MISPCTVPMIWARVSANLCGSDASAFLIGKKPVSLKYNLHVRLGDRKILRAWRSF
jgi:hypothetical protein